MFVRKYHLDLAALLETPHVPNEAEELVQVPDSGRIFRYNQEAVAMGGDTIPDMRPDTYFEGDSLSPLFLARLGGWALGMFPDDTRIETVLVLGCPVLHLDAIKDRLIRLLEGREWLFENPLSGQAVTLVPVKVFVLTQTYAALCAWLYEWGTLAMVTQYADRQRTFYPHPGVLELGSVTHHYSTFTQPKEGGRYLAADQKEIETGSWKMAGDLDAEFAKLFFGKVSIKNAWNTMQYIQDRALPAGDSAAFRALLEQQAERHLAILARMIGEVSGTAAHVNPLIVAGGDAYLHYPKLQDVFRREGMLFKEYVLLHHPEQAVADGLWKFGQLYRQNVAKDIPWCLSVDIGRYAIKGFAYAGGT